MKLEGFEKIKTTTKYTPVKIQTYLVAENKKTGKKKQWIVSDNYISQDVIANEFPKIVREIKDFLKTQERTKER